MDLKTRYRQTFAHVKAPPQLTTEVLNMTEQKRKPKKFIARRLVAAAIATAMLGALALGANAATGGELFDRIVVTFAGEGFRQVETSDGSLAYQGEVNGEDIYVTFEEPEGDSHMDSDAGISQGTGSQQEELKESQSLE